MKSRVATASLATVETPLLAVAVAQCDALPTTLISLDQATGGILSRAFAHRDFRGKRDETLLAYPAGTGAQRLLLVGLGKPDPMPRSMVRRAAAVAARRAATLGVPSITVAVESSSRGNLSARDLGQAVVEGAALGGWRFTAYQNAEGDDEPRVQVDEVVVIADGSESTEVERGRALGQAVAAGHRVARTLQAEPGNVCTPRYLAEQATALGAAHGFGVTVLDRGAIESAGMHALLAVARGSGEEPRFVELSYRGAGDAAPVVLVGKGITFDSGGISIKAAASMEEMKYDMSGAAAVLGTFEAIGRLAPAVNVVGLIPSAENLPSGTALKPGDVIRSHLGKTIEVVNTDAEGRLILCDALSFARRHRPACVLDVATLTGGVVVALGAHAIGLMGNDDRLIEEVRAAGERAGERCWPLPLWDEYRELNKSEIADVKNSAGRSASTISAGWFLREFTEGYPWAHLDIAGTAYTDRDEPASPKGPTGVGVRLFAEFLLARAA